MANQLRLNIAEYLSGTWSILCHQPFISSLYSYRNVLKSRNYSTGSLGPLLWEYGNKCMNGLQRQIHCLWNLLQLGGRVGGGGWACLLEEWAILCCHWKLQCATPYLTSLLFPTDLWSRSTQVSDQPLFGLAQFWPRVPSNGITVDIPFIGKLKNISSCLHSLSLSLMGLVFLSSHLLCWTVDRTCHHPLHL